MTLKEKLQDQQKAAMRAKDKVRLGAIRMLMAEIKQREVDNRIELSDDDIIAVITKMVKQRKDSIAQFEAADRQDLVDKESEELSVLQEFLPQPLTEEEVDGIIAAALESTGAQGMQDMGKVMAAIKSQIQGRADMGQVSGKIKASLS
ncbi:GatB/YqeY domain-containing protein [Motilimonas sp. 1_MG-2023]|uniref:GatB/YqeY domain-containing protein n=1 Tax=Motilimonas sp. 1_MG-2023 TaxID=3062672 RepID=UPI0026E2112E|nr:GatB/YqeY domain-containing protein [Motilimonas sp. 1_MG-2023]MDO6526866.1 GatB/YqeY domain-containing protein [Motilimonas sp. 1_MG-2023]